MYKYYKIEAQFYTLRKRGNFYLSRVPGKNAERARVVPPPPSSDTLPCIKTLQKQASGGGERA